MNPASEWLHRDSAAVQYANIHHLDQLVDTLICEVAENEPQDPIKYMASYLQQRIEQRTLNAHASSLARQPQQPTTATMTTTTTPTTTTTSSAAVVPRPPSVNEGSAQSNPGSVSDQTDRLGNFGVWRFVRYEDIPHIVNDFHMALSRRMTGGAANDVADMRQNTDALIHMLATAAGVERTKGFEQAMKLVPLRPHVRAVEALELLAQTILDYATHATRSQERAFLAFMKRVGERLQQNVFAAKKEAMMQEAWHALRGQGSVWRHACEMVQFELFLLDPAMVIDTATWEAMVDVLDEVSDLLPAWDAVQKRLSTALDAAWAADAPASVSNAWLTLAPDHFVLYGVLVLNRLEASLDRLHLSMAHARAFEQVMLRLAQVVNHVFMHAAVEEDLHVRLADERLWCSLRHFFARSRAAQERHRGEDRSGDESFAAVLHNTPGFSDEACTAFLQTAASALRQWPARIKDEPYIMYCKKIAFRSILHVFIVLVQLRHRLTLRHVQRCSARCFVYGVQLADAYAHLQRVFYLVTSDAARRDSAMLILSTLHRVFLNAPAAATLAELQDGLRQLVTLGGLPHRLPRCLRCTSPAAEFTTTMLTGQLGIESYLQTLLLALPSGDDSAGGLSDLDSIFAAHMTMATRLRLCGLRMAGTCGYLSMALLAATSSTTASATSTSTAAMELLALLSGATSFMSEADASDYDRNVLRSHLRSSNLSRLIVGAIEYCVHAFPSYRSRIVRPVISYEAIEQQCLELMFTLLSQDKAQLAATLRPYVTRLAVYGAHKADYSLFALCLTRQLRKVKVPEPEWVAFQHTVLQTLVALTPTLRPLRDYADEQPQDAASSSGGGGGGHSGPEGGGERWTRVRRAQACARRFLFLRHLVAQRKDRYYALEQVLKGMTTASAQSHSGGQARLSARRGVTMTAVDRQVVQLSWGVLDEAARAMTVYRAVCHVRRIAVGEWLSLPASQQQSAASVTPSKSQRSIRSTQSPSVPRSPLTNGQPRMRNQFLNGVPETKSNLSSTTGWAQTRGSESDGSLTSPTTGMDGANSEQATSLGSSRRGAAPALQRLTREEQYKLLQKCQTIATRLSALIDVLRVATPTAADRRASDGAGRHTNGYAAAGQSTRGAPQAEARAQEDWITLYKTRYEGNFGLFFEQVLSQEELSDFCLECIAEVCSAVHLTHPGVCAAWTTFMGCFCNMVRS